MGKQYGHLIIDEVKQLKEAGLTKREIGEQLGYSKEQIKELLKRQRKKEQKIAAGVVARIGRPPRDYIIPDEAKTAELRYILNRKEYRIKQLERENELLRDFLKETGRR